MRSLPLVLLLAAAPALAAQPIRPLELALGGEGGVRMLELRANADVEEIALRLQLFPTENAGDRQIAFRGMKKGERRSVDPGAAILARVTARSAGAALEVSLPLEPREPSRSGPPPQPVAPPEALTKRPGKPLDRAELLTTVRRNQRDLQRCYERGLGRDPKLAGHVTYQWTITPAGEATNVLARGGDLNDAAMLNCMTAAIKAWRFPASGAPTKIHFPFVFKAAR